MSGERYCSSSWVLCLEPDTWNDGAMKGRVLVVDDDAALAEMLGIVLRGEGFEPTFVADGDKALDAFRETRPTWCCLT